MPNNSGKMPEEYIDRPATPFVQLRIQDLEPEHGEGYIGVGDVAVDMDRQCWVLRDAPVFGADFRDVAPIVIRRTPDGGYEVEMGGLPDESNFTLLPAPDASAWVGVEVAGPSAPEADLSRGVIPGRSGGTPYAAT